ncbi:transposase [Paraburkholderia fungorum]|uniref:Transposase n=1 Tax=Paraburkholderia fungorum TaxID=134537 RepID=A0AAP5QAS0_9BURK|nr:zinc ribbon domain-containing protein [Paraburkholderia fungorum]MDT8840293.1 transposase [Paraburkholderia fungorum]
MMKTYVFGLLPPDKPDLVATHLAERARVWNRLVELHEASHGAFMATLGAQHPDVGAAQQQYEQARQALADHRRNPGAGGVPAPEIEFALKRAVQQRYAAITQALKPLKDAVRDLTHAANAQFLKEANQITGASFLWWPNRNLLMQEVIRARQQALRRGGKLRRRMDLETGVLAIPFASPVPASHLTGRCPNLAIEGDGRKRTLRFTIATLGKKRDDKVLASFPMVMHRQLPPDAMIKLARLVTTRVGVSLKYEIHLVVDMGVPLLPKQGELTAAINMGWRITETGLRVAAIRFSDGSEEVLELPAEWMLRFDYMEDLEAGVRRAAAADMPLILPELEQAPAKLRHSVERITARPGTALGLRALGEHWAREAPLPPHLHAWYHGHWRKFDEAVNLRKHLLARRTAIYRNFVANLGRRVREITIEQLDLAILANRQKNDDSWIVEQRRGHRQRAALSTLRAFLSESERAGRFAVHRLSIPYLSQECHICGTRNAVGSPLMVTCSGCAAQWDQDFNNAANLLRAIHNQNRTA